jgi:hypothetical protein
MLPYPFVNRIVKQLPADARATVPCRSHNFRKRVRKVIIRDLK